MKAKRFKEFILEATVREEWDDGTKIWFDGETDFSELLGTTILQIRTHDILERQLFDLVNRVELGFNTKAKPIILNRGTYGFSLWFSIDKQVEVSEIEDWSGSQTDEYKKYIDIFKSNASGVNKILNRGGRLTSDQLVQLLNWVEGSGLARVFLEEITQRIKGHPNWPEDMTDWALSGW
jgi:hypothetical protein